MKTMLWISGLLLAWASCAGAETHSLPEILAQQKQLASEMESGAITLTPRQQSIVRKSQEEVYALTEGKSSLDDLNIAEKVRLDNALEQINAQVVGTRRSADTKDVCWREYPSGSRIAITKCGTQEEIDQAREGARGYLERPRICTPPGCGQ